MKFRAYKYCLNFIISTLILMISTNIAFSKKQTIKIEFSNKTFDTAANFSNARFDTWAYFSATHFGPWADFSSAHF